MGRVVALVIAVMGCGRVGYDASALGGAVDATGNVAASCESCPTFVSGIAGAGVQFGGEQCVFVESVNEVASLVGVGP